VRNIDITFVAEGTKTTGVGYWLKSLCAICDLLLIFSDKCLVTLFHHPPQAELWCRLSGKSCRQESLRLLAGNPGTSFTMKWRRSMIMTPVRNLRHVITPSQVQVV